MNRPSPHHATGLPITAPSPSLQEEAEARDFERFIAGQDPLDAAAAGWMVRRHDGLTPAEEAEFQAWLAADPAHAEALEQVEGVWGRMDELPDEGVEALKAGLSSEAGTAPPPSEANPVPAPAGPPPSMAALIPAQIPAQVSAAAPAASAEAVTPAPPRRPRPALPATPGRRAWLRDLARLLPQAAAGAAALGVLGGGWYGWNIWQNQPLFEQTLATARGQIQEVPLPDGSTLWLDTSTRAEVVFSRQRREVRLLDGQALFAVQARAGQPFDVLAGNARITVVGTRFAVRHTSGGLADDGSVNVVVEEGRVRVAGLSAAARQAAATGAGTAGLVELRAGQSVTADAMGMLGPVGRENAAPAAWREGRVSFNGTSLARALAEFERYGDTGLVIHDPAVAALRVQGSFDLHQVDAFARALPKVLPVQLRPLGGRTEIAAAAGGE